MDNLKTWLVEVGIKKMGPSAIRAALAAFVGYLMAHANLLAQYGIVYDKATDTIFWHLTTLREWADISGLGLIAAAFMAAQHHTVAAVTGAPQTGADQGGSK